MPHFLIGWELGGGHGHALRISKAADALLARGHRVTIAAQRLDVLPAATAQRCALLPVPVTPRMLAKLSRRHASSPATMGDILARLGFDDSAIVTAALRAWDELLRLAAPDAIVADYAPFLLLAARFRVPSVRVGTPFSSPPGDIDTFPSLTGGAPASEEAETLDSVNRALGELRRPPIQALPQLFAADRDRLESFAELDPYARLRGAPLIAPPVPIEAPPREREEVFVYMAENLALDAPLWTGLAESGLPVRLYTPGLSQADAAHLHARGFAVEPSPVPFGSIAARSRLLVHHGGHGAACSSLLAGLPQVICHFDLEKILNAAGVTRMGVGGHVPLHDIDPLRFGASLRRLFDDGELAARAKATAADLRGRTGQPAHEAIAEAAEALV